MFNYILQFLLYQYFNTSTQSYPANQYYHAYHKLLIKYL